MLQQNARTLTGTGRTGKCLIVTQVALSLVLLMDAGLLVRTLQQLRAIDLGFHPDGVLVAACFRVPTGTRTSTPITTTPICSNTSRRFLVCAARR